MGGELQTDGVKELVEKRRARLAEWIRRNHDDNATAFARSVDKKQSQIADMLDGRKSFGEKVARDLELRARMPVGYLDSDTDDDRLMYHGLLLTRAAAQLAAEWEKLDLADRIELEEEIRRRVQTRILGERERLSERSAAPRVKAAE